MSKPSFLQIIISWMWGIVEKVSHIFGRHAWVAEYEKDIEIINGEIRHQDGSPPTSIYCDICGKEQL